SQPRAYTTGGWVKHQAEVSNSERALASKVVAALTQDPVLRDADINVRVHGSIVTLTGQVFDLATYQHAIEVVQGVEGVRSVVSRIELDISK
ncbi:MAG TPA: BON domain-containing protein, partial [Gammaproteobacteria bacterium]|nr:BON domain-containing protein [Gammaproteobacteria bacterium]